MTNIPVFLQHMNCFDGRPSIAPTEEFLRNFYSLETAKKRKCKHCGKLFTPKQQRSAFCSQTCGGQYRYLYGANANDKRH